MREGKPRKAAFQQLAVTPLAGQDAFEESTAPKTGTGTTAGLLPPARPLCLQTAANNENKLARPSPLWRCSVAREDNTYPRKSPLMLPIAHMSPTSVRRPMILTRTWVPCSITMSALLVNCAGVELASYWISSGISCAGSVSHGRGEERCSWFRAGDGVHGTRQTGAAAQPAQRSRAGSPCA